MKTKFSNRDRLLNHLVLHSMDNPNAVGLLRGQMGLIIGLTKYLRTIQAPYLEVVADCLMDNVLKQVERLHIVDFADGLSGICWGIEYLVQNGIMPGPAHNICENADVAISRLKLQCYEDFSLGTGLLGIWRYAQARIQGNMLAGLSLPFPNEWLCQWISVLENRPSAFPPGASEWLVAAKSGTLTSLPLEDIAKNITVTLFPNSKRL